MDPNDTIYEIAQTDAWAYLLSSIQLAENNYRIKLVSVAGQKDFSPTEVARWSGYVQAMSALRKTLYELGAKQNAQEG